MIVYCLQINIITLDNIKYVIKSSLTLKHDYFNKFIQYVNDKVPEHSKLAINSMIGTFNRNLKKMRHGNHFLLHLIVATPSIPT